MKILASLFKPFYRRLMNKVRADLDSDEILRLHHHAIIQNDLMLVKMNALEKQISMLNILMGGVIEDDERIRLGYNPAETYQDIIGILSQKTYTDVAVIQLLNKLDKSAFDGKSVCIIGSENYIFYDELKKRGAKNISSIETNPFVMKEISIRQKKGADEILFVYPSKLRALSLEKFDTLFIPSHSVSSYLLKQKLFQLGALTKKQGIFVIEGIANELKKYRLLLHESGFSDISEIKSKQKTYFDYENIITDLSNPHDPNEDKKIESTLFIASKLPSVK